MSITRINPRLWIAVVALLAAVVLLPGRAHAANVTVDLCAASGSVSVPVPGATPNAPPTTISVPILGYVAGDCTTAGTAAAPGGPVVAVNVGDVVTVNLHNNLGETTGLLFQGQAIVPDLTGTAGGTVKAYTFTASQPGTYLYEAALLPNAQHQVAMGLYGALLVRPATAGQAYDANTLYDDEAVLVLSELDPALNASPATFDMRNYKPKYWLVNGQAYPNTASFTTVAGHNVLLRYVNAGMQHHSMTVLGLNQKVIATDGSLLANAHTIVAETIAPGQTLDAIATVPAAAAAGSKYPVYDGNLALHNSNTTGIGGLLTFLSIAAGAAGPDTTGPATGAVTLAPNRTSGTANVALSAQVSDAAAGNNAVGAAEYFVDTAGANGTGTALAGSYGSPTVTVNGTLSPATLAALASGSHTIYVHGQDALGNWGAFNFAVLTLDKSGPQTTGLALSANPTNGTVNVTLTGTANDSATGGSNAAAAEYFVGTPGTNGTGTPLALNTTSSPVASLSATIAAASINALPTGSYVLNVHSRDALGNWGAFTAINLNVDKTAPTVSGVTAKPNPTNGLISGSAAQPAVQVDATFVDAGAVLAAAVGSVTDIPDNQAPGIDSSSPIRAFIPLVLGNADQTEVAAAALVPGTSYVQAAEAFLFTINDHVPTPLEYGTGLLFTANDGASAAHGSARWSRSIRCSNSATATTLSTCMPRITPATGAA
ncbi:MAG: multicopper oxidase domain-containing protein [Caldilineaceae bacterium]